MAVKYICDECNSSIDYSSPVATDEFDNNVTYYPEGLITHDGEHMDNHICKKCAIREHGNKNKRKLEDIIDERTEKWLQKQKIK